MAITGIFNADFSKFNAAVEQANVTLKGFQTNGDKVEASLNRVANSLSGQKVIQQATLMAKAVADIGGVSKLTADELDRVQSVAQQAVAKFEALGRTAPKAIQDLADAGKNADNTFEGLGVDLAVVGGALTAIVGVATGAAAGFGAILEHTISLGNNLYEMSLKTGASVENLSRLRYVASQTGIDFDSFGTSIFKMEKLLGSTGAAADKAQESFGRLGLNINELRQEKPDEAFINIVTALEQIPGKADQAAIGAAIFGKGFKDMAGLASANIQELLADADKLGLVMTTETAAAAHAAEIGFKSLGLQLEAVGTRIASAFLPAIIGLTQDVGTLFTDAIEGANDELSKMGGSTGFLSTVARAMGAGDAAIAAQAELYGYLRDGLIGLVRYGLEPAVIAFSLLMQTWDEVLILGNLVALGYEKITYAVEGLLYYSAKLEAFSNPFNKDAAEDVKLVGRAMDELGNTIADTEAHVLDLKKNQTDWAKTGVETNKQIEGALKNLGATHVDVGAIIKKFTDESKNAYGGMSDEIDDVSDKITDKFTKSLEELTFKIDSANFHGVAMTDKVKLFGEAAAKAALEAKGFGIDVDGSVQAVADAFNKLQLDKILAKANEEMRKMGDQVMKDLVKSVVDGNKQMNKAWDETTKALLQFQEEGFKIAEEDQADSLDKRLAAVQDHFDKERAQVRVGYGPWAEALQQIDDNEAAVTKRATAEWQAHADQVARLAPTVTNAFKDSILQIPQLIGSIFTGGDIGKAIASFTTQLGSKLGSNLLSAGGALNGLANKLGSGFVNLFGKQIGGTLAAIIPGIGSAIGALAGPLVGAIGGLFNKIFGTAGRDAVTSFANSFGGFDALHAKLQAAGDQADQLWIALTQGVGRNNPEQAQAIIGKINALLQGQDDYMSRLPDEMQKYGLSWEQAGKAAEQSHLDSIGSNLVQTFADLTKAGFDVDQVTQKMSGDINAYVDEAIRTGTEVPAAMKPLLQRMIDLGELTDDAGNKIDNLDDSGIAFSETLTEGFKSVVDAINQLTKALGGVPGAISAIPRNVNVDVNYVEHGRPSGNTEPDTTSYHQGTALVAHKGLLPGEVMAVLQTGEAVLNKKATSTLGQSRISSWNAGNFAQGTDGSGGGPTGEVHVTIGMSGLRQLLQNEIVTAAGKAVRKGAVTIPTRVIRERAS